MFLHARVLGHGRQPLGFQGIWLVEDLSARLRQLVKEGRSVVSLCIAIPTKKKACGLAVQRKFHQVKAQDSVLNTKSCKRVRSP